MLKTCNKCGGFHEVGACPKGGTSTDRIYKAKPDNEAVKLRRSARWQRKRIEILKRDRYCCKLCLLDGIVNNYNLQVHHIIPILENSKLKLEDSNLISLCTRHHALVEDNKEYRGILKKYVNIPPMKILEKK